MNYNRLGLCQLTPEQHGRTCGYWFTVTDHSTAHTAFRTKDQLMRWLEERNIELTSPLVAHGEHSYQQLKGEFNTEMHMSYDKFYSLPSIRETRCMSNGNETLALITEDENGIRTIHSMNVNCKYRLVYNFETGLMQTQKDKDKWVHNRFGINWMNDAGYAGA